MKPEGIHIKMVDGKVTNVTKVTNFHVGSVVIGGVKLFPKNGIVQREYDIIGESLIETDLPAPPGGFEISTQCNFEISSKDDPS